MTKEPKNLFADIIIDRSAADLDHTFSYKIPQRLRDKLEVGSVVKIPFGQGKGERELTGYIMRITDHCAFREDKVKEIRDVVNSENRSSHSLMSLALWIRDYYGSTTIQALRTVMPFRKTVSQKQKKTLHLCIEREEARAALAEFQRKKQKGKVRLLEALIPEGELPWEIVTGVLKISPSTVKSLQEQKIVAFEKERYYRTPAVLESLRAGEEKENGNSGRDELPVILNEEQQQVVDEISSGKPGNFLIHGVTGSGKTAVYIELIARVLAEGKQAILLIPEISLTYQNVLRFYKRFGDRISILHSRLTPAERYDQFQRAALGDIDIMIGPRSALFTPFPNLGMIIIDEEHESSYISEQVPRYQARRVAEKRAELEGASLVLGSATPSIEAYYAAKKGDYRLFTLKKRAAGGSLAKVTTIDLREELRAGNRSIISNLLYRKIRESLERKEQVMLFLNRRGYAGFISCRSCGEVVKCPHCDVSLSLHRNGKLICHYCGYEQPLIKKCPVCGSESIGAFRAGTQQLENSIAAMFPDARILRMDADTTKGKDGHAEILRAFGKHEADILLGTQMIVKGHDFPQVTLVGILAADLSLNISDYSASEKTFQLLTQAAGRAGRGNLPGRVVIQTYDPDHYAITCAARQDYEAFFEREMLFRSISGYPPAGEMMAVHCAGTDHDQLFTAISYLAAFTRALAKKEDAVLIGPADEAIGRINDTYHMAFYVKHERAEVLTGLKNVMEQYIEINSGFKDILISFERR